MIAVYIFFSVFTLGIIFDIYTFYKKLLPRLRYVEKQLEILNFEIFDSAIPLDGKNINDRIKDLEEFRNHLEGFDDENK